MKKVSCTSTARKMALALAEIGMEEYKTHPIIYKKTIAEATAIVILAMASEPKYIDKHLESQIKYTREEVESIKI